MTIAVASAADIEPNSTTKPKLAESTTSVEPCPDDCLPLLLKIILAEEESDEKHPSDETTQAHPSPLLQLRHLPLTAAIATLSTYELLNQLEHLDEFRRNCDNLYQRVRALFFLYAAHRFHLPERRKAVVSGLEDGVVVIAEEDDGRGRDRGSVAGREDRDETMVVCPKGYAALLDRRFHEAIDHFLEFNALPTSKAPAILPNDERHATSTADSTATEKDDHNFHPKNSAKSLLPGRTSLISNLSYSRSLSTATEVTAVTSSNSTNASFYRYSHSTRTYSNISNISTNSNGGHFLEGENIAHFFRLDSHSNGDDTMAAIENSQLEKDDTHVTDTQQTYETTTTAATTATTTHTINNTAKPRPQPLLLPSDATSSALAKAYRSLAFQTLADQVKSSVRSHPGNEWMFRVTRCGVGANVDVNVDADHIGIDSSDGNESGNNDDGMKRGISHPLKWRGDLLEDVRGEFGKEEGGTGPMLVEKTPVRMDISHSW